MWPLAAIGHLISIWVDHLLETQAKKLAKNAKQAQTAAKLIDLYVHNAWYYTHAIFGKQFYIFMPKLSILQLIFFLNFLFFCFCSNAAVEKQAIFKYPNDCIIKLLNCLPKILYCFLLFCLFLISIRLSEYIQWCGIK